MQKESVVQWRLHCIQKESGNAMEAPFKLNLNGVEMEVKPPFDLYFIPIDNPTTFNTIFTLPPPP
jgi:hypothetical protein